MGVKINYNHGEFLVLKIEDLAVNDDCEEYTFELTNQRMIIYRDALRKKNAQLMTYNLRDIVMVNGKPNIIYNNEDEDILEYYFANGCVKLFFGDWNISYMTQLMRKSMFYITGKEELIEPVKNELEEESSGLFGLFKRKKQQEEDNKEEIKEIAKKCKYCGAPISGPIGTLKTCVYCDSTQQL